MTCTCEHACLLETQRQGGEKRVQSLLSLVGGQQKLPKTEIWRCKIVSMLNLEMRSMLSENNEF